LKILIVGSNKSWAIERFFIRYLKELGAEVHLYAAPDLIFDRHTKNIFFKILFKTKISTGYVAVNKGLMKTAEKLQPDVIWVFKGMEIFPSTLRTLGQRFKLANYNPDHPFIIASKGGGNQNVRNSVGLYDLHFCYSLQLKHQIEQEFKIPAVFLPFGFDLSMADYQEAIGEPEILRVCFLGNPDGIREKCIAFIAENGFEIDVYGHGWDKTALQNKSNVRMDHAIYGLAFWKKLRAYRVQLNIFREHNAGSHNMRSFEIPAVGGIQLAPYSEEQSAFFETGKEIFFYKSDEEMIRRIKELLAEKPAFATEQRKAARNRSLDSDYSYKNRSATVYAAFKNMIGID